MHLLKEENSARTPANYTSQAHEKFSYVFKDQKTAHTTLIRQEIIEGGKKTNSFGLLHDVQSACQ